MAVNAKVLQLHAALVAAQLCFAGFEILTRNALFDGANGLIFTLYRNVIACLVLGPIAYFLERKRRPPLNLTKVLMLFGIAFLGVTFNQLLYLYGLKMTSAVFASAVRNLIPISTFVLAAILRVDRVNLRRRDGIAKVTGSILALCGAALLTIFHAAGASPAINQHQMAEAPKQFVRPFNVVLIDSWSIGSVFLVGSLVSFSASLIFQASVLETYPAPLSIGSFCCFFSSLQLGTMSLVLDRHVSSWKLTKPELLSLLYAGLIGSAFVSGIQSWGVHRGGPVIVAAYQPLETVAVTVFSMVSGGTISVTSTVGIAMVMAGMYLFTWGQEEQRKRDVKQPLLREEHSKLEEVLLPP